MEDHVQSGPATDRVAIAVLLNLIRLMGAELVKNSPAPMKEFRRLEAAIRRKLFMVDTSDLPPEAVPAGLADAQKLVETALVAIRAQAVQFEAGQRPARSAQPAAGTASGGNPVRRPETGRKRQHLN